MRPKSRVFSAFYSANLLTLAGKMTIQSSNSGMSATLFIAAFIVEPSNPF